MIQYHLNTIQKESTTHVVSNWINKYMGSVEPIQKPPLHLHITGENYVKHDTI